MFGAPKPNLSVDLDRLRHVAAAFGLECYRHGLVRVPRFDAPGGQVKTSAAWLIDKAGFGKGYGLPGPVALSTKHVLAVTNRGSATAADVVALAREIRDGVHDAFGVTLVNEPVLVGATL